MVVRLRMLLRLKFDEEKYYNSFVPTIKPVLDQIASSSKKVKLSLLSDPKRIDMTAMDDYLNIGPEYSNSKDRFRDGFQGREVLLGQEPCMSPMRVLYGGGCMMRMEQISRSLGKSMGAEDIVFSSVGYSQGSGWSRRHRDDNISYKLKHSGDSVSIGDVVSAMEEVNRSRGKQTTVQVILVCGVNKAHTVWNAVFYQVDKRTAAAFMIWCNKYGAGNTESYPHHDENTASETVQYNVSYCDKGGGEVLMNKWRIPRICLMNADWGTLGHPHSGKRILYISPFFGCFSEEYVQWHDALIKTDLLPEIESVKIELDD